MKAMALLALSGLVIVWLTASLSSEARAAESDRHAGANGKGLTGGRAVECDAATVIMRALQKLRPGETLIISGICAKNVEVDDRFLRITADGSGTGVINAPDATI